MGRLSRAWTRLRGWLAETGRWLVAHPTSLVAVALAGLGGMGVAVPLGDDAYTYMWADDRFCDDCHVHDWANEAFAASVHHGMTTCHDCHLVPIRHYPRNLVVTVFDPPQSPEDIHRPDVERVICARCHSVDTDDEPLTGPMSAELRAQVVKVDESPLHAVHLSADHRRPDGWQGGDDTEAAEGAAADGHGDAHGEGAGGIGCMDCHGAETNRAHSFAATRDNCVSCHTALDPSSAGHDRATPLDCRTCHFEGFVGRSLREE